ncbi:MAG: phage upper tail fiber protein [Peptostreptococcaceae bacterium]
MINIHEFVGHEHTASKVKFADGKSLEEKVASGEITGNSSEIENSKDKKMLKIWYGSLSEYNAVTSKDPSTIYYITGLETFFTHNHNTSYYLKNEVDDKITPVRTSITNLENSMTSYLTKVEATSVYAPQSSLALKVDKITGKGLSTNDYTDSEKNKLATLVNYSHPASHSATMITEDTTHRFITDAERTAWNNKSNFTGNYLDLTNKPTIPVVDVTKSYVDTELNKKLNISDSHSHSNKGTLDLITSVKMSEWDNKASTSIATTTTNGLMSSVDKTKLNSLSSYTLPTATENILGGVKIGANINISDGVISVVSPYTHPSNHPATIITEDSTHRFVTDAEKTKWNETPILNQKDNQPVKMWIGTYAEYVALAVKDSNTLYTIITG